MAKFFKNIYIVVSCVVLMVACQEGNEAGDLLGQWRMNDSDTKYVRFSGNLAYIDELGVGGVWGHFVKDGDSLFIQCYSIERQAQDTLIVEDDFGFKPFENIRLRVECITDDRLLLSGNGQTWSFYKY